MQLKSLQTQSQNKFVAPERQLLQIEQVKIISKKKKVPETKPKITTNLRILSLEDHCNLGIPISQSTAAPTYCKNLS